MPSLRKGKSTQGEYVTSLSAIKKGDVHVAQAPNLPDGHQPDGFFVRHSVTRTPRYIANRRAEDWRETVPDGWPADWGPPDEEVNPVYMVDLYNPGPGFGDQHGHYQMDVPMFVEEEGDIDYTTGNPPELGSHIRKAARVAHHKRSAKDPRPKTAIGGLVRDLRRIVPNGDPATNSMYVNSVARAIQRGVAHQV